MIEFLIFNRLVLAEFPSPFVICFTLVVSIALSVISQITD